MNRGSTVAEVAGALAILGFNEAPIHESGKSRLGDRRVPVDSQASMRPRFMNRGSATRCCVLVIGHPGFNEAPIHESGKLRCGLTSADPHRTLQ